MRESPYFDIALTKDFKEASTREFRFPEHSVHAFWRGFEYMYRGDYSENPAVSLNTQGLLKVVVCKAQANDLAGDDLELLKHPRVFALADIFLMPNLQAYALLNFKV